VLPDSLNEIGGNAHIERTVSSAGKEVYARLLHGLMVTGFRPAPE
jgi:hypothetical protein